MRAKGGEHFSDRGKLTASIQMLFVFHFDYKPSLFLDRRSSSGTRYTIADGDGET